MVELVEIMNSGPPSPLSSTSGGGSLPSFTGECFMISFYQKNKKTKINYNIFWGKIWLFCYSHFILSSSLPFSSSLGSSNQSSTTLTLTKKVKVSLAEVHTEKKKCFDLAEVCDYIFNFINFFFNFFFILGVIFIPLSVSFSIIE